MPHTPHTAPEYPLPARGLTPPAGVFTTQSPRRQGRHPRHPHWLEAAGTCTPGGQIHSPVLSRPPNSSPLPLCWFPFVSHCVPTSSLCAGIPLSPVRPSFFPAFLAAHTLSGKVSSPSPPPAELSSGAWKRRPKGPKSATGGPLQARCNVVDLTPSGIYHSLQGMTLVNLPTGNHFKPSSRLKGLLDLQRTHLM